MSTTTLAVTSGDAYIGPGLNPGSAANMTGVTKLTLDFTNLTATADCDQGRVCFALITSGILTFSGNWGSASMNLSD
jgi:hypothetical protein